MPEGEQYVLFEFKRSGRRLPKRVRSKPCGIHDPDSYPIPERFWKLRPTPLTEEERLWLEECGIVWEQKPAVQLPLDFCDRRETVRDT